MWSISFEIFTYAHLILFFSISIQPCVTAAADGENKAQGVKLTDHFGYQWIRKEQVVVVEYGVR